ncbi:MAG TPA: hypothetical protein VHU89_11160 [Acidobacteriaceae bacterium]|jgi:hypothetical protein|nr:hypothetical protein [Acidobacteriaceae bacterium]
MGRLIAIVIILATAGLVVIGTLWPIPTAAFYAGETSGPAHNWSTPQAAVQSVAHDFEGHHWAQAYASLDNKGQFTEQDLIRDLSGAQFSLRSFAVLEGFHVRPLHEADDRAKMQLQMHWSTVVGDFNDTRDVSVVRVGNMWKPVWPIVQEPHVPPQVIAVNYLRWDVIYRGGGDDWAAENVEGPHIKIVDMHPVERAAGVVVMGELLNEDVVPAYVHVEATLSAKNGKVLGSETSFDRISHLLLPKQVTPFFILFPNATLADVGSIQMQPTATLVAASADPVIEIQNQKLNPVPNPSLTGALVNQSGQTVNIAHVLGTFYDKNGQLVWVAESYIDRALLPQTPVPFTIPIPEDLARQISSERAVVSTYSSTDNL